MGVSRGSRSSFRLGRAQGMACGEFDEVSNHFCWCSPHAFLFSVVTSIIVVEWKGWLVLVKMGVEPCMTTTVY